MATTTLGVLGWGVFIVAGLLLFLFEIYWFNEWWGGAGIVVAVFVPPIAACFPFIFLALEGLSLVYLGVWAVGLAGVGLAAWAGYE